MYRVVNLATGKAVDVNFEQLCSEVGEQLDEAFYTEVFIAHTLTGKDGQLVIAGE